MKLHRGLFIWFLLVGIYNSSRCEICSENHIKLLATELDKRSNGAYNCHGEGRYIVFDFFLLDNSLISKFTVTNIVDEVEGNLAAFCATNFIGAKYNYHYIDNAGNDRLRTLAISPLNFLNMNGNSREVVSLKDHPKAAGVNIELTKPKGWEEQEGNGPHIVKKFEVGANIYMVHIRELPTFVSKKEADALFHDQGDISLSDFVSELFTSDGVTILSYMPDILNRYPALHVRYEHRTQRMGFDIFTYTNSWIVLYEDKIISIVGSSTAKDKDEQKMFDRLYASLVSNIRFPDQFNY